MSADFQVLEPNAEAGKPPGIPDDVMLWLCKLQPEPVFTPDLDQRMVMYEAGRRSVVREVIEAYQAQRRTEEAPMPPKVEVAIGSTRYIEQRVKALFDGQDPNTIEAT